MNPYRGINDYQFWRRGVTEVESFEMSPMVAPKFRIGAEDRIVTAGSCFAQHLANALKSEGFRYFVPEDGADLSDAEKARRQFGPRGRQRGRAEGPVCHLRRDV